jgi:hypothetical protein
MAAIPTLLRRGLIALVTGMLLVSTAWAGVSLTPAGVVEDTADEVGATSGDRPDGSPEARPDRPGRPGDDDGSDGDGTDDPDGPPEVGGPIPEDAEVVEVGAARRSIVPAPGEDDTWLRDDSCRLEDPSTLEQAPGSLANLVTDEGLPWPSDPDCLYMGGYGVGPVNPILDVDDLGLSVRALAIRDADGATFVLTSVDAVGLLWERKRTCPECGAKAIAQRLGEQLDIDPAGIWLQATHSHTAPDLVGLWGGVPEWYLHQVTTAIEDAVTEAVTGARPAVLEVGEEIAREHNRERRSTYRSAVEQHLAWARALAVDADERRYLVDPDRDAPEVVATLGAYAGHPTTVSAGDGIGHPDWPALFERALRQRDGGEALHAMTGLGNLSASGGTQMGLALAGKVPAPGTGRVLTDARVQLAHETFVHPVSNTPLALLGVPGFVDRPFLMQPSTARSGPEPDTAPCVSAGPASVEAPIAAARIGDGLALSAAPGELYSNLSNTLKEQSGATVTMPLSLVNDMLGYIGQSFEMDRASQQGPGFFADGYVFVDYEDSYAIDLCFGDEVLERTIGMFQGE